MSHKQIIVIRKDLKMRTGKAVAQGAHASLAAILNQGHYIKENDRINGEVTAEFRLKVDNRMHDWLLGNFKKVCVYVNSEEELLALYAKAKEAGIITSLITDSGLTEFHGIPTNTCIAVGPDFEDKIDTVTGGLPLL
jgi:PTH2 family peptidyl-tRNA hydrolase